MSRDVSLGDDLRALASNWAHRDDTTSHLLHLARRADRIVTEDGNLDQAVRRVLALIDDAQSADDHVKVWDIQVALGIGP